MANGAIACQTEANGNFKVPRDFVCSNTIFATELECPTVNATLIRGGPTGLFLTTADGSIVAQSATDGNLVVPQDVQCGAEVVANAFKLGDFRLFNPPGTPNIVEMRYLGQRVCRFSWSDGSNPAILVDTLKASFDDKLTISDNLHVTGNLTVQGATPTAYWACCNIDKFGVAHSQKGMHNIVSSKMSGDTAYYISFPAHPDGVNYVCLMGSTEYHCIYYNETSSGFTIYLRNLANSQGTTGNGRVNIAILK